MSAPASAGTYQNYCMAFRPRGPPGPPGKKKKQDVQMDFYLYWQNAKKDKRGMSLMPLELRNLSPNTSFSASALWAKTKEDMAEATRDAEDAVVAEEAAAEKALKSGKSKKGKKGKAEAGGAEAAAGGGKAAEMVAANIAKLSQKATQLDQERLSKLHIDKIRDARMETPLGTLTQLFMVLAARIDKASMHSSGGKECFRDAFDTLWEIESLPIYVKLKAQNSALKSVEEGAEKDAEKAAKKAKKKAKEKVEKDAEKAKERAAAGKEPKKDKKDKKEEKELIDVTKEVKKARRAWVEEQADPNLEEKLKLLKEYKKVLRRTEKAFAEHDMLKFQLTEMANYLPPLNLWGQGKFSLDGWQKDVLEAVDRCQSVIVAAPTSSGKTVCSTYVVEVARRVLFVVPTEPLVWQVASMFQAKLSAMFNANGGVSMVTDRLQYRPDSNVSRVTVGTPQALETALSGVMGSVWEGRFDYAKVESGYDFDYAVYDEVHDLNGREGAALQRLIRCVHCPFLALSATIGNPGQLQSWWTSFNGIDTGGWPRVIDGISGDVQLGAMGVTPDALLSTRLVAERAALDSLGTVAAEEVEFETWYTRPEGAKLGDIGLEFKHDADTRLFKVVRCSAPSFELGVRMGDFVMLVNGQAVPYGYDNEALRKLQLQIKSAIRHNPFSITFRGPHRADRKAAETERRAEEEAEFAERASKCSTTVSKVEFSQFVGRFINLQRHIFIGEKTVTLHPLAALDRAYIQAGGLNTGDMAFTPRDTYELWDCFEKLATKGIPGIDEAFFAPVSPQAFFGEAKGTTEDRITLSEAKTYEVALKAKLVELTASHPDLVDDMLKDFRPAELDTMTEAELDPMNSLLPIVMDAKVKHLTPAICFQLDSVRARDMFDRVLADLEKKEDEKYPSFRTKCLAEYENWKKENEQKMKLLAKLKEEDTVDIEMSAAPDPWAPHPEFMLCAEKNRVGPKEHSEIREKLLRELAEKKDAEGRESHPLLRGLSRGVAIYTDDAGLAEYQRVVQNLAQRGMLAVVFSDYSLAYGVNMPFRTCCFCGDCELLDPLMAQQMAGRAGRRGLDREGHLVYTGLSWGRVKSLMRGTLPEVYGKEPRYPTMALNGLLSPHHTTETAMVMCSRPLDDCRKTFPQLAAGVIKRAEWQAAAAGADETKEADTAAELEATAAAEQADAAAVLACLDAGNGATSDGMSYYLQSETWMKAIGLVEVKPDQTVGFIAGKTSRAKTMFILRDALPESIVIAQVLDEFYDQFCSDKANRLYCASEGVQIDFLGILTRFCCLDECPP